MISSSGSVLSTYKNSSPFFNLREGLKDWLLLTVEVWDELELAVITVLLICFASF